MTAVGGENVTTTVEGRERYPVNVRYMRDTAAIVGLRSGACWFRLGDGRRQIPHRGAGDSSNWRSGPSMLRDENGMLTGYVYVDVAGRDIGSYVAEAKQRGARRACSCRRVYARVERPVRSDGARARAAEVVAAADAVPDLPAAVPQHAVDWRRR